MIRCMVVWYLAWFFTLFFSSARIWAVTLHGR